MPIFIVLTGGPGGGKTTLINELRADPAWQKHILALPEATSVVGQLGIAPWQRLFERLMVEMRCALEDTLARVLEPGDRRIILCHRGTLDSLAFWLEHGWTEDEFYSYTCTTRDEHYRRYAAVIHLVTAADGAIAHYARWPQAHRPEQPEEAVRLDQRLEHAWGGHLHYRRIGNVGKNWPDKACEAKAIIRTYLEEG